MQCPKCRFENREGKKFCAQCGNMLENICPNCQTTNLIDSQFCDECGYDLTQTRVPAALPTETKPKSIILDQERKHVTVMLSDLSGYTAMTEKLDPEEVKEIMDRIFGKISQVVVKYEGFIEKFIGDAVMVIFGIPKTHEDDPLRAIRAAREIHNLVKEISLSFEKKIDRQLYMHTGINTGLVVAKEIDLEKGTHGVLGDSINVASRISDLAGTDEIIVGLETYHQAEAYFNFDKLEPTIVKGKEEPIQIYKVLSTKETTSKTHRLSGLRAELIGRKVEIVQLNDAVENLKQGKTSIFSITGDAGTGKSRLIEEFKKSLDLNVIQWREGHCYSYAQNIPYFPLIDLLSRAWQIKDGDNQDQIRQKVESGTLATLSERKDLIPYIGNLFSLTYTEAEQVSPERFKAILREAIKLILANLCQRSPTVVCIEDLHWADPSSVELLKNILIDLKFPIIILCLYRPNFTLFTSHQAGSIKSYREIRLLQLSPTDAQNMVESLLKTKTIPRELQQFVRNKAEGNPFYLEEVINSLIETDTLIKENDLWKLTRTLTEKDIPSTVHGVISARLDRLEREAKRILQEASVIGRTFLYEILKRISELKEYIDKSLINLERLDLIKTISLQPEMEYIFKHALTQEVVYNGLLLKERRKLHEKIALVMEELFHDRLSEFYETLAYHYSQSDNVQKAYEYLELSGDKAVQNNANNEAIRFYKEALRMLDIQPQSLENKKEKLAVSLKIFIPWLCLAYPEGCLEIFQNAVKLAEELGDKESLSQSYNDLGTYYTFTGNPVLGVEYAEKGFYTAEKVKNYGFMAQSAMQLCIAYWFTGNFSKIIDIGGKTLSLLEENHLEMEPLVSGLSSYSMICAYCGGALSSMGRFKEGNNVLEKGFHIACEVNNKMNMGAIQVFHSSAMFIAGYGDETIAHAQKAISIFEEAEIPMALESAWMTLGGGYYLRGEYEKAIEAEEKALELARKFGLPTSAAWSNLELAIILIDTGHLKSAKKYAEEALRIARECNVKVPEGLALVVIGCTVEETTSAVIEEAQHQISKGISILKQVKAKAYSARGYIFFGEFFARAGRKDEALKNLMEAETLFQEMEVTSESYWLTRIKNALAKLR